jgi:serine/threonine protein kinase
MIAVVFQPGLLGIILALTPWRAMFAVLLVLGLLGVLVAHRRRVLQLLAQRRNLRSYLCPSTARLQEFLEGRLAEHSQAGLADHMERCAKCQQRVEILEASQDAWSGMARQLRQPPPAPEPALKVVMDKLKGEVNMAETTDLPQADDDLSLTFLTPSDQPGHLGRLGPYEILEVIGRGGMGIVLKAFDPSLQRVVAIKVLAPHLATSGTARRRFIREAQAAAAVSHDHVITIHAVEENHRPPYLVMQYIAGMSLQQRLDQAGPLGLKEVLRIAMQTAAGLAAAHAQGLIHRDIKPANILLENGLDRVKITDFGLARAADDASVTQSGFVPGTPQYMAPEQARGEPLDHRADLFSLGSTLYAMCTGRPPFRASSTLAVLRRVADDTPRPIKELNPDIPTWLAAIIEKLHAKHPANRFQSAAELAELLGRHLAQLQQPSWVPPTAPPVDKAPAAPAHGNGPLTSLTICPSCSCQLHVPEKMVGKLVNCPQCSKPFRVEDTSEELYIVRMDASGRAEPHPVPVAAPRPAKPRRKMRRWIWILGGVAALILLAMLFATVRTKASRARVEAERAAFLHSASRAPAAGKPWGLDWFPADATCYGAIDFRSFRQLPPNDELIHTLRLKNWFTEVTRLLTVDHLAIRKIDRASFAYSADPLESENARVFVRLTGQLDRRQLELLCRQVLPNAVVQKRQDTVLFTSPKTAWGVALIGKNDLLLARYQGGDAKTNQKLGLLDQALHVRAGREPGLRPLTSPPGGLGQPSLGALVEGQVPDSITERPEVRKWFPVMPGSVSLTVTREGPQTKLQWVLSPVQAGEERALLDHSNRLKQQAAQSLAAFLAQLPESRTNSKLSQSLARINLFLFTPGGFGGPTSTLSVGGKWTLSPEELQGFTNLLKYLP